LRAALDERLADHPNVGEIRGRGLLQGIELVADRESKDPFPRSDQITERIVATAKERGVLLYYATGNANGTDGDEILLGPPFIVTDAEIATIASVTAEALDDATRG
jgi:adenosylmethionine-8-amino-7-oxononanoate aminotransferase